LGKNLYLIDISYFFDKKSINFSDRALHAAGRKHHPIEEGIQAQTSAFSL